MEKEGWLLFVLGKYTFIVAGNSLGKMLLSLENGIGKINLLWFSMVVCWSSEFQQKALLACI